MTTLLPNPHFKLSQDEVIRSEDVLLLLERVEASAPSVGGETFAGIQLFGRLRSGREVGPGVYFARLEAAGRTQVRALTLMR